jgi:hypothetical protein
LTVIPKRNPVILNNEEIFYRREVPTPNPAVFQIDMRTNKDLKILRKPTVSKKEIEENIWRETHLIKKTNYDGKRYTIVNEQMKKTFKPTVINF